MILDVLADRRLLSRTIIIVTSDHGEELGDHGGCYHIRSLHEEVVRVPLVIYVPDTAPQRIDALVPASVAVAPTVLELMGLAPPPEMTGRSLLVAGGAAKATQTDFATGAPRG